MGITISKNIATLLALVFIAISSSVIAQKGKDGAETITTTNVILNRYTTLAATGNIGATSITINNINDLAGSAIAGGQNNPYKTDALTACDLLMIIKMQGAAIDNSNTSSYGTITAYNGVGSYDLVEVGSVAGNVITLAPGFALQHNYVVNATERVQVIRIPRISTLTVNGGASLTGRLWANTGYTGGIVAVETNCNIIVNGTISATGIGFRGGEIDNNTSYGITSFYSSNNAEGAEKGEGVAGFQNDYDALGGRYGRGAPANGGGGGNAHNAGGGGGANVGTNLAYTGLGNPDIANPSWTNAWNLEYPGFANAVSSGGGRGGYTFGSTNQDALTVGTNNALWGGDNRCNVGGYGGHPLNSANNTLLFLGGGGGAGDSNNNSTEGGGGRGGGIIFLLTEGNVSGTGSITANGNNGSSTIGDHIDAPSGAGAGGSIVIVAGGTITGVAIAANGGNGGNQSTPSSPNESEGPGGGGSGGYVLTTNTAITISAAAGNNGTTTSMAVTEFIPNGATKGDIGTVNTLPLFFSVPPSCHLIDLADTAICAGNTVTLTVPDPINGVTYHWYTDSLFTQLAGAGVSFTTPALYAPITYYIQNVENPCALPIRDVTIMVNHLPPIQMSTDTTLCNGGTTTLNVSSGNGSYTYSWTPANGLNNTTITNPIANPLTNTTYTATVTDTNNCSNSDSITVSFYPEIALTTSANNVTCNGACDGNVTINANNGVLPYTYSWTNGCSSASCSALCPGSYTVTVTDAAGCTATADTSITEPPPIVITSPLTGGTICPGDTHTFTAVVVGGNPGGYIYSWSSPGNTNFATSSSVSVSPVITTLYTLSAMDSLHGCVAPPVSVTINVLPVLAVNVDNDTGVCIGNSVVLNTQIISGTGSYTYSWTPATGLNNTTIASPQANPVTATTYTLTVSDACSTITDSINVNIYSIPTVTFGVDSTHSCNPICVQFTDSSSVTGGIINQWSWNFGDNSPNSSTASPEHCYSTPGQYSVTLTVTSANGCSATHTNNNMIEIYNRPSAAFTPSPLTVSEFSPTVTFFNQSSSDVVQWYWNFGDGDTTNSSFPEPTHTYPASPDVTYPVILIVQNNNNCYDTATNQIMVTPEYVFYIPNAFTPDNDGKNDYFFGKGVGIIEYDLWIFDRWGNMIYHGSDIPVEDAKWDGKANNGNNTAQIDVYVWKVELKDIFNKSHSYIGTVTLVK